MIRKLLYLIPILLAVLCLSPWALQKDTVGFAKNSHVPLGLAPQSWKLLSYGVSANFSGSDLTPLTDSKAIKSYNPPLTTGATYKGFPFGAYFNNATTSQTGNSTSSLNASAWSWLWGAADLLLIIASLTLAMMYNRRNAAVPATYAGDGNAVPIQSPLPQAVTSPTQGYIQPVQPTTNQQPDQPGQTVLTPTPAPAASPQQPEANNQLYPTIQPTTDQDNNSH